jgi:hypothetical protein
MEFRPRFKQNYLKKIQREQGTGNRQQVDPRKLIGVGLKTWTLFFFWCGRTRVRATQTRKTSFFRLGNNPELKFFTLTENRTHSLPCSLFPVPCSLFPVPFLCNFHNSYRRGEEIYTRILVVDLIAISVSDRSLFVMSQVFC